MNKSEPSHFQNIFYVPSKVVRTFTGRLVQGD